MKIPLECVNVEKLNNQLEIFNFKYKNGNFSEHVLESKLELEFLNQLNLENEILLKEKKRFEEMEAIQLELKKIEKADLEKKEKEMQEKIEKELLEKKKKKNCKKLRNKNKLKLKMRN